MWPAHRRISRRSHGNRAAPAAAGTSALLHFNGANNGTVFTDERGNTWTAPGNAVTQTTTKQFGTAAHAGAAHASQGGVIQCANANFNLLAQDFNVDFWWRTTSYYGANGVNLPYLFWWNGPTTRLPTLPPIGLYFYDFNKIAVYISTNGSSWVGGAPVIASGIAINLNTWYHIEVSRTGAGLYLFVDGVQKGGTYNIGTTALAPSDGFSFCGISGSLASDMAYSTVSQADELRIQVGSGHSGHTAGFTPPVAEYA